MWVGYHRKRTLITLEGLLQLTLPVRLCRNRECSAYGKATPPEEEGALALPQVECGLDVIAFVGACRYAQHRSVPQIHQQLLARGVVVSLRTVTNLLHRYEELVALRLSDQTRLQALLSQQGRVILALDGLQPDVGQEVLWVLRDCLSGEVLLAQSLLSATEADLVGLIEQVKQVLPVPIAGVISDGQQSIRNAVKTALPSVPHQLCQYHYLREAAKPVYEADRHAKKELKKQVRGIRPIERSLGERADAEAEAVRDYCLAVRSALTDDGRPPLAASGLTLQPRLSEMDASLSRVAEKRGCPPS
jgi:hypothetical protein